MAQNTLNVPKIVGPICRPKPKSLEFSKNMSLWVSVVRDYDLQLLYSANQVFFLKLLHIDTYLAFYLLIRRLLSFFKKEVTIKRNFKNNNFHQIAMQTVGRDRGA